MWDRHPVSLALVHMLPRVAEERGVALAPLLERAGILEDIARGDLAAGAPTGRAVARAQISTLLQETARRSGDATIGLDLAASAEPVKLGLSGRALFSGRTLRECLAAHMRHMPTLQGGVELRIQEREGRASWHHVFLDSDPAHAAVLNEGVAGFMVGALRAIAGGKEGAVAVSLPHHARSPARHYEDKLAADVTFGNGHGLVISFDALWLDRPNPLFGAAWAQVEGTTGSVPVEDMRDDSALMARLDRLISAGALIGALSLVDAARSLGLPPRTLQRRLSALGTSFEMLVDHWRRREAREQLAQGALPVASIARRLGYSDPAHFIRAFRRWEGHAPLAWRRAALARNGN